MRHPACLLAVFDVSTGTPSGKGFVALHRGHLLVLFSSDGGGGGRTGGFGFFDVSDPRAPELVFSTQLDPARYLDPDAPDFAGNLREPHGDSFWGDVWCQTTNRGPSTGLQYGTGGLQRHGQRRPALRGPLAGPCLRPRDPRSRRDRPSARGQGGLRRLSGPRRALRLEHGLPQASPEISAMDRQIAPKGETQWSADS